jgi:ribosomal protein L11 methylase PrmA
MDSKRELEIFLDLFDGLPQQGLGDDASTRKALEILGPLPVQPRILDVGCGSGRLTLCLAAATEGKILAVDTLPVLIQRLEREIALETPERLLAGGDGWIAAHPPAD